MAPNPPSERPRDRQARTAATNTPPPFRPSPATPKTTTTGAAFNAFINAHPIMRPYSDLIWKWAKQYGVDQVVAAALFWRESFAEAQRRGVPPETIESPTGAGVGIGQINPNHIGDDTPWGSPLKQTDLTNATRNVQWAMWFFAKKIRDFGSADAAYNKGYNPGYPGPPLTSLLPKGYVPRAGLSPQEQAEADVAKSGIKKTLTDPWVVLEPRTGKQPTVKYVTADQPPENVLKRGGLPVTRSVFEQLWHGDNGLDDIFRGFAGRNGQGDTPDGATAAEAATLIGKGLSQYAIKIMLTKTPAFIGSPVWKQHAPGIIGIAKQTLGQDWKVDRDFIRRAIAESWDQATLETNIRNRPEYEKGPEFQTKHASFSSVWGTIYGRTPDQATSAEIKGAVRAGWTGEQFAAYLRQQPSYRQSAEAQYRYLSLADALGMLTGQHAVLQHLVPGASSPAPTAGAELSGPAKPQTPPVQQAKLPPNADLVPGLAP